MARELDLSLRLDPGGEVFHRRFTRFISEVTDFTEPFEEMVGVFTAYQRQVWATQGAESGSAWAALQPSTVARKGHDVILVDTGALRQDMLKPGIKEVSARRLALGTRLAYAGYHQTGFTDRAGGRVPARPVIRLTEKFKTEWTKIIHRHLVAAAAGRGV